MGYVTLLFFSGIRFLLRLSRREEGRQGGRKEGRKKGRQLQNFAQIPSDPVQRPLQLSKEDSLGKLRDICFLVAPSYTTTNQPTVPRL